MFKQRVITALLLLAVLLPALFSAQTQYFVGLTLLLICAGAWEWGRLNGWTGRSALWGAVLCAAAGVLALQTGWARQSPPTLWAWVGGAWVLLGVWMIRAGVAGWPQAPRHLGNDGVGLADMFQNLLAPDHVKAGIRIRQVHPVIDIDRRGIRFAPQMFRRIPDINARPLEPPGTKRLARDLP